VDCVRRLRIEGGIAALRRRYPPIAPSQLRKRRVLDSARSIGHPAAVRQLGRTSMWAAGEPKTTIKIVALVE
jgi:hypothetical protein